MYIIYICISYTWLDDITYTVDMNLGKLQEMLRGREAWRAAVHGAAKSWTRWTHWVTEKQQLKIYIWDICVYQYDT